LINWLVVWFGFVGWTGWLIDWLVGWLVWFCWLVWIGFVGWLAD
jgi:hypothetical protein